VFFPVLKPDELVYSAVARAGIAAGIVSHKQLLDVVYSDRKVVATLDLPCQLEAIASHLHGTGLFPIQTLLYQHTLLPLYAPFVDEGKRIKAKKLMEAKSQGAVHMTLGVAASRLKAPKHFRYCEFCYNEQISESGEGYWLREWFLPGLAVCAKHKLPLIKFEQGASTHRHSYQALYPPNLNPKVTTQSGDYDASWLSLDLELTIKAAELLNLSETPSPNKTQWSQFYFRLAQDHGLTRGKNIDHGLLYNRLSNYYPPAYLSSKGLFIEPQSDTNWLRTIFRKHRKSFNYLQHLIVWRVFLPEFSVADILGIVTQHDMKKAGMQKVKNISKTVFSNNYKLTPEINEKRDLWRVLVARYGIKTARNVNHGGALYAWLYRHDNDWLMSFNRKNKQSDSSTSFRKVDWASRDRRTVRGMFQILYKSDFEPVSRRMSKRWFLQQFSQEATLSKNIDKLPLTAAFLDRYSETITEYQLRRVAMYVSEKKLKNSEYRPWEMLRGVGLSKQRMTMSTEQALVDLGYYFS
jgi:hypothetical protein